MKHQATLGANTSNHDKADGNLLTIGPLYVRKSLDPTVTMAAQYSHAPRG